MKYNVESLFIITEKSYKHILKISLIIIKKIGIIDFIYYVYLKRAENQICSKKKKASNGRFHYIKSDISEIDEHLKTFEPDIIVLGQSYILPKSFLQKYTGHIINVHPCPLPNYRGYAEPAHQIQNWIDENTSIQYTLHHVNENLDSGPIIAINSLEKEAVFSCANLNELLVRTRTEGYLYLAKNFNQIIQKNSVEQQENQAKLVTFLSRKERRAAEKKFKDLKRIIA